MVKLIKEKLGEIKKEAENDEERIAMLTKFCEKIGAKGVQVIKDGKTVFDTISKQKTFSNLRLRKEEK